MGALSLNHFLILGAFLFALTASSISSMAISSTIRFLRFRKMPITDSANSIAPSVRKWPRVSPAAPIMPGLLRWVRPEQPAVRRRSAPS